MALIEKGADQPASFEELTRQAEQEAGVPPDSEYYSEFAEPPVEAEEPTPAPIVEEPEPEAEPSDPEIPPETPEVEAQAPDRVDALEKELADAKQKLGQLINENADFRRGQEEAAQRQAQQPLSESDVGWFDDLSAQNPSGAAQGALENRQPLLYDRAIRSWYDIDPVNAGRYERQVEQQQMQAQMQAQMEPQIAGAQKVAFEAEIGAAVRTLQTRHEDFNEVVGTLTQDQIDTIVEENFPPEVAVAAARDQKGKEQFLELVYRWRKADNAGQLVQAAQDSAGKTADESRAAKVAATVASASTTTPPPVEETEAERQARVWSEDRPSVRSAWQGQDSRRGR